MSRLWTPIHHIVAEAVTTGRPLTVAELRQLRQRSERHLKNFKVSFWTAIVILNLLVWVPLPFALPLGVKFGIGGFCLAYAFSVPIVMMRRHQQRLEALKLVSPGPKRRQASAAGQAYIDQVKEEGRSFVRAELEVLSAGRQDGE